MTALEAPVIAEHVGGGAQVRGRNEQGAYGSFAELAVACAEFCDTVKGRVHRETCAVPAQRLEAERARLHRLPDTPHTAVLGTTRVVNTDQTIRFGSVRYSTPPGLVEAEVWVRAEGDELRSPTAPG